MTTYLWVALVQGFNAGISPGSLSTLIIAQTLRHNLREGMKVAIAPILTDTPIVLASLFVLGNLQGQNVVLGWISIVGGLFLAKLAWDGLRTQPVELDVNAAAAPQSILRGMVVNALSPQPYLFWMTLLGPQLLAAARDGFGAAAAFLAIFYGLLVGLKLALAVIVSRLRDFMKGAVYVWVMRAMGALLGWFAVNMLLDGWRMIGG
jgi:threonine/homoserine/homoserine lactone efflux protein